VPLIINLRKFYKLISIAASNLLAAPSGLYDRKVAWVYIVIVR